MKTRLLKKLRRKFSRKIKVWRYGDYWYARYDKRDYKFESALQRDIEVLEIIYFNMKNYICDAREKQFSTKQRHPYFW